MYSAELVDSGRGFTRATATIGVLAMNKTLLTRAVVQTEFRRAADLFDRVTAGAGMAGVKAIAPIGIEPVTLEIAEGINAVSILGEKLVDRRRRHSGDHYRRWPAHRGCQQRSSAIPSSPDTPVAPPWPRSLPKDSHESTRLHEDDCAGHRRARQWPRDRPRPEPPRAIGSASGLWAAEPAHTNCMQVAVEMPDVEAVALCDAYTGRLDRARARTGGKATVYKDYRELLASPSVDAVFIATPDHWHKTMAIDALSPSKDIYLEKPMSFAMADGPAIVEAVSGRTASCRSAARASARRRLPRRASSSRPERSGQVTMVRAAYNRNGDSGAWLYPIPPDASPATVNWEQFLGPAPKRPFDPNRFFRWRCYWDYSGGIATDLFVHLVSRYHHALDLKLPGTVMAAGANYRYKATHEVPDTVNALLMYPEGVTASLICTFNNAEGTASGLEILGTKGSLALRDGGLTFTPESGHDDNRWVVVVLGRGRREARTMTTRKCRPSSRPGSSRATLRGAAARVGVRKVATTTYTHIANFVSSVKTRTQPVEDAAFGHRAAACAHMVNQSIREKRIVEWQS